MLLLAGVMAVCEFAVQRAGVAFIDLSDNLVDDSCCALLSDLLRRRSAASALRGLTLALNDISADGLKALQLGVSRTDLGSGACENGRTPVCDGASGFL